MFPAVFSCRICKQPRCTYLKGSDATVGLKQDLEKFSHLHCLYLFSTLKELDIKQSGFQAAKCLEELRGPRAPQQELKFDFILPWLCANGDPFADHWHRWWDFAKCDGVSWQIWFAGTGCWQFLLVCLTHDQSQAMWSHFGSDSWPFPISRLGSIPLDW